MRMCAKTVLKIGHGPNTTEETRGPRGLHSVKLHCLLFSQINRPIQSFNLPGC